MEYKVEMDLFSNILFLTPYTSGYTSTLQSSELSREYMNTEHIADKKK